MTPHAQSRQIPYSQTQMPFPPPPPMSSTVGGREQLNDIMELFRQEMRNEMDQKVAPLERENRNLQKEVESLRENLKANQSELSATKRALSSLTEACEDQAHDLASRRRSIAELQARVADDDMWRAEVNQRYHTTERVLRDVRLVCYVAISIVNISVTYFLLLYLNQNLGSAINRQ